MEDNSLFYGLLIGLAIVIFLMLWDTPVNGRELEHFTLEDHCDEMFHHKDHLTQCKARNSMGELIHAEGIAYTYPKYLKNKAEKIELTEDLYWSHVRDMQNLSNLGKCHTVFHDDELKTESCTEKDRDVVNALHDVYWFNRMRGIHKSPVMYQQYLNSATDLIREAERVRGINQTDE